MQMRSGTRARGHHDIPELSLKWSRTRKRQRPDAPNQTACPRLRFWPETEKPGLSARRGNHILRLACPFSIGKRFKLRKCQKTGPAGNAATVVRTSS